MVGEPVVGVYIFLKSKILNYLVKSNVKLIKNNNKTAALRGYLDIKWLTVSKADICVESSKDV